jgi:hypothetical protein
MEFVFVHESEVSPKSLGDLPSLKSDIIISQKTSGLQKRVEKKSEQLQLSSITFLRFMIRIGSSHLCKERLQG